MAVVDVLMELGGAATRAQLLQCCGRAAVDRALDAGDLVVVARGRYALPEADEATLAAHRVRGAVSHRSAALRHGWGVLHRPTSPEVTVPKHRRLTPRQRDSVALRWANLPSHAIGDGVTTEEQTLLDCLRSLPLPEGLAVADSALRAGFGPQRLAAVAAGVRGRGSPQVRRVAQLASPLAANPFESGLRGIAADVRGLDLRPQVSLYDPGFLGRPDLVDEHLRIVAEAESFEHHGGRAALADDCRRYNRLAVHGWLVLRFVWEDVMFHPEDVRGVLADAVELQTQLLRGAGRAA